MAETYTYPHTSFTVKAKQRRVPTAAESTATTLLAPFACDRGPENELVAIDTFSDFIQTYGELDYSIPDQRQILYIGRWLSGGGRVLACRLTDIGEEIPTAAIANTTVYFANTSYSNSNDFMDNNTIGALSFFGPLKQEDGKTYYGNTTVEVPKTEVSYYQFVIKAKYSGTYYNDIKITIVPTSSSMFNLTVVKDNVTIESYRNKTLSSLYTIENNSEYIGEISVYKLDLSKCLKKSGLCLLSNKEIEVTEVVNADKTYAYQYKNNESIVETTANNVGQKYTIDTTKIESALTEVSTNDIFANAIKKELLFTLTGGADVDFNNFISGYEKTDDDKTETVLISSLCDSLCKILKQPLETPFDCFIDCGYRAEIKNSLVKLFCTGLTIDNTSLTRNDAFLYLSNIVISGTARKVTDIEIVPETSNDEKAISLTSLKGSDNYNMQIVKHYEKVEDIYSKYAGKQVFVTSNYWYARLVPYNDATYGVQWPTAGLTRGIIDNCLYIDSVPSNFEKQSMFDAHYNYIEKDSRGMYFMTQLTGTTEDTALIHTSKVRALLKMKKNLTKIARQYLHEFNDSITQNNLLQALNTEMSNWIQNRTLSYAQVELYDYTENSSLTNEELQISLNITFTGTVELIPFDITVS